MNSFQKTTLVTLFLASVAPLTARASMDVPDTCWKNTTTRGAGVIPTTCASGYEDQMGLCYPLCQAGYTGVLGVCWEVCGSGYTDTGLFCELTGAPVVSKNDILCTGGCPTGYTDCGCFCGADTYAKSSYPRPPLGTVPDMPSCPSGQEEDAGLCYSTCPAASNGVGPVCWGGCPSDFPVSCGAMCATSDTVCGLETAKILVAVSSVAMNVATAGTAGAAADKALTTADNVAADTASATLAAAASKVIAVGKAAKKAVQPVIDAVKEASADYKGIQLGYVVTNDVSTGTSNAFQTTMAALNVASTVDPTGLVSVVASLTKPICGVSSWGGASAPAPWAVSGKFFPYAPTASPWTWSGGSAVRVTSDVMNIGYQGAGDTVATPVWTSTYTASDSSTYASYAQTAGTLNGVQVGAFTANYLYLPVILVDTGSNVTLSHTATTSDGKTYTASWNCTIPATPTDKSTLVCASTSGSDNASFTFATDAATITFDINGPAELPKTAAVELVLTASGNGSLSAPGCSKITGACTTTPLVSGNSVTVTANIPTNNHVIWGGACASATGASCTLANLVHAEAVTAYITDQWPVNVSFNAQTVGGSGAMIILNGKTYGQNTGTATVTNGSAVTISYTSPNVFSSWGGLCADTNTTGSCKLTASGAISGTLKFTPPPVTTPCKPSDTKCKNGGSSG